MKFLLPSLSNEIPARRHRIAMNAAAALSAIESTYGTLCFVSAMVIAINRYGPHDATARAAVTSAAPGVLNTLVISFFSFKTTASDLNT